MRILSKLTLAFIIYILTHFNIDANDTTDFKNKSNKDCSISNYKEIDNNVLISKCKLLCIPPGLNYSDSSYDLNSLAQLDVMHMVCYVSKMYSNFIFIRVVDTMINLDYLFAYNSSLKNQNQNRYLIKVYGFSDNSRKMQRHILRNDNWVMFYRELKYTELKSRVNKKFFRRKFRDESNYEKFCKFKLGIIFT